MKRRLDAVDLSLRLSREEELKRLNTGGRRLVQLRLALGGLLEKREPGPPVCLVFEGWDASGKGGAIKRLVSSMDPRHVRVAAFAAPTDDERRHHFLSRFVAALPGWGGMAVLDRSWYGLVTEGTILLKFWMHISSDEQLRRFEARARDPLKAWKLTEDDWRNRSRRRDYEEAIEEMLERTDRPRVPWQLVAAESKPYARVSVMETTIAAIEQGMRDRGLDPPPPP